MNQAYATREAGRARRLLDNLARRLEHQHPGAAASLREGLEETLTVMRLGLPANLERVLSSTNLIENLFSRVREIGRRVKRWQSGTMVLRWTAAGVLEAQRGFRKLAGYRALPALVAARRAHDAQLDRTEGKLDTARNAAYLTMLPLLISNNPADIVRRRSSRKQKGSRHGEKIT